MKPFKVLFFLVISPLIITPCNAKDEVRINTATSKTACFKVEGMTCASCSTTLKISVKKLKGINSVEASSDEGSATVSYEPSIVDASTIKESINSTGYKATEKVCSNDNER